MHSDDPLAVGSSRAWRRIRSRVHALAPLRVPVWIAGEPGSGRDLVARAIHRLGGEGRGGFERLREMPQLATSAIARAGSIYLEHPARLERAEVIHLDGWLTRQGEGERPRLLVAAPREWDGAAESAAAHVWGRFRIELPALRERPEDLPELVAALARRAGRRIGRAPGRLSPAALALLRCQSWPGNLCELERVIEQALAFSIDGTLSRAGIESALGDSAPRVHVERQRRRLAEREELLALIEACGGNLAEVARRLGLSRGAVFYRARKYGLLAGPRRVAVTRPAARSSCGAVSASGAAGGDGA